MSTAKIRTFKSGICGLLLTVVATSFAHAAPTKKPNTSPMVSYECSADSSWFTSPSLPSEVKQSNGPGDSSFCDFYQFSWQTFAYLMAKSTTQPAVLNFQDSSQFSVLEVNTDGSPANSCDDKPNAHMLFIRSAKPQENGTTFTIPERIGQAGGGATIYDQNKNVVYYDVRFSKNMCQVDKIKQQDNFPGGTTELKTAWKVMGANDNPNDFITMEANITPVKPDEVNPNKTLLGLVGFHLAVATPDHPEFVWATFEHQVNAPDCTLPQTTTGWSFASESCTASLKAGKTDCDFNNPTAQTKITGEPTEICRVHPYGSAKGDLKYDDNVGSITSLNDNVQPFLTGQFAVLKNYFNVGALWVSDIKKGSSIDNQRGSLRLANTVAETEYQDVDLSSPFISNCFGCHNYAGTDSGTSNTTSNNLSHIFDDIAVGNQCVDVPAVNIINSQAQAKSTCPSTCTDSSPDKKWNGQWTNQDARTGAQLPKTVCGCCTK
ncbi:mannan-binding lectin [Shewanella youngdeokensis]|uniref:Mannan-binding lectin n=1 Tax=Shewanella youngdeokensis TaxID=2999068 RepID=A0ABZ0JZ14_9GAMM|nr:mannan-binding lectin [Shewanella sp. DAU334]